MTTTDALADIRASIDQRIAELQPVVDEHARLVAAAAALQGVDDEPKRRGPGRPARR